MNTLVRDHLAHTVKCHFLPYMHARSAQLTLCAACVVCIRCRARYDCHSHLERHSLPPQPFIIISTFVLLSSVYIFSKKIDTVHCAYTFWNIVQHIILWIRTHHIINILKRRYSQSSSACLYYNILYLVIVIIRKYRYRASTKIINRG